MSHTTVQDLVRQQLHDGTLEADPASGNVWVRGKLTKWSSGRYLMAHIGGGRSALVHRVIWIAEHGEIPDGTEINHKNGDRLDNRIDNLEAVSHRENVRKHYDGDGLNHLRPADIAESDPEIIEEARRLAASNPSRQQISDFMESLNARR